MPKRKDYIGWDEYFMGVALLSGERSKDPNSQVGACIVSDDNKILSIDIMAFLKVVQMMKYHGKEKENTQKQNILMYAMEN